MSWTPLETERGTWSVNWDYVRNIIRWYHSSELIHVHKYREDLRSPSDRWLFSKEPIVSLSVDWDAVTSTARHVTATEFDAWRSGGVGRGGAFEDDFLRSMLEDLAFKIRRSRENKERFQLDCRLTTSTSLRAVEKVVAGWDSRIDAARTVRDLCADVFVIGVGVVSGGTGGAVASGVIKGATKLQDTGSLGAAGVTLGGEIVAGFIPVPGGSKAGQLLIVAGVKGGSQGVAALIIGADASDALLTAAAKSGEEMSKFVFKNEAFKKWLASKPIFVDAQLNTAMADLAAKYTAKGTVAAVKYAFADGHVDERSRERLVSRATFFASLSREETLLKLAVIPPEGLAIP